METDQNEKQKPQDKEADQPEYALKSLACLDGLPEETRQKIMSQLIPLVPKCHFLETLPIEIRNMIYNLLLFNSTLGHIDSIFKNLELSPNILRTCSIIHAEALEILYGKNEFFMSTVLSRGGVRFLYSPVSRYKTPIVDFESDKHALSGVAKVRKWKVLVSNCWIYGTSPYDTIQAFCRAICHRPPKTLTVMVIPKGYEDDVGPNRYNRNRNEDGFREMLKPFQMLRNVENFLVRDAKAEEIARYIKTTYPNGHFESQTRNRDSLVKEISELAKSSDPIEFLSDMYFSLLRYVQAFKRFKPHSNTLYMGGLPKITQERFLYESQERFFRYHPVETATVQANYAVRENDEVKFKLNRAAAIEYLEPQYLRIINAGATFTDYIKSEKVEGGILTVDGPLEGEPPRRGFSHPHGSALALVLVEDYAYALFNRDVPDEIRAEIKMQGSTFHSHYANLPADSALRELQRIYEANDAYAFPDAFRTLVDLLDTRYLEIRQARQALFIHDHLNARGCDIEVEEPAVLDDGPVDWSVHEPRLGPRRDPNIRGSSFLY